MDSESFKKIDSLYGTPFYLFDETAFIKNFEDLSRAFNSLYDNFILAYSYKTNYTPYLCGLIKDMGGWAEVVSRLEYDIALRIGQNPAKIIFNGPVKYYEDIEIAFNNGSLVNLDDWYEIDLIDKYAADYPGKHIRLGIRVNVGLCDQSGDSHIQSSLKTGRFGFSPDRENLQALKKRLDEIPGLSVVSLHGHTSTTDRSLWCFETITRTLCGIAESCFPDTIEYLNIGGGFFGYVPPEMGLKNVPSFDEYAHAVVETMKESKVVMNRCPKLVIEPGVAMVANTFSFVTKVVAVKTILDQIFVIVDGSAFHVKPTMHNVNQPHEFIYRKCSDKSKKFDVVGSTCMEKDIILKDIVEPLPQRCDYIRINNVGAYTTVLSPPFINPAPPILTVDGRGNVILIRHRQSLDHFLIDHKL